MNNNEHEDAEEPSGIEAPSVMVQSISESVAAEGLSNGVLRVRSPNRDSARTRNRSSSEIRAHCVLLSCFLFSF